MAQHEAAPLGVGDVRHIGELPVTSPARTLLDLGAVTDQVWVERAVESAIRTKHVSYGYLAGRLERASVRGRRGLHPLRKVLAARGDVPATESELETRCLQAIRAAGLPEPVRQYELVVDGVVMARFDLAYPDELVNVEAYGLAHHNDPIAIVGDWRRQNAVVVEGWCPFLFTWDDAMNVGRSMAQLEALLESRRAMARSRRMRRARGTN